MPPRVPDADGPPRGDEPSASSAGGDGLGGPGCGLPPAGDGLPPDGARPPHDGLGDDQPPGEDPQHVGGRPDGLRYARHDADRTHLQPAGCTLRRYTREAGSYWHGLLPKGRVDVLGRRSKSGRWGHFVARSEPETIDMIEEWLRKNAGDD